MNYESLYEAVLGKVQIDGWLIPELYLLLGSKRAYIHNEIIIYMTTSQLFFHSVLDSSVATMVYF